jgi:hypothetical protein
MGMPSRQALLRNIAVRQRLAELLGAFVGDLSAGEVYRGFVTASSKLNRGLTMGRPHILSAVYAFQAVSASTAAALVSLKSPMPSDGFWPPNG